VKSKRHSKILELIGRYSIDTQEELLKRLKEEGLDVTQATVSRDIKELRLIKIQSPDGKYKYAAATRENEGDQVSFKLHAIFSESVRSIDYAMNTVVVKCYTGLANAACAALDKMHFNGLVGTIAGDDTIFVLMRSEELALQLTQDLAKMLNK